MIGAMSKVSALLAVVLGAYLWTGYTITEMTGGEARTSGVVEVTPEGGEQIFWGKGRCYTCHSVGGEGSAVRCPNLGQFGEQFPLPIGERAAARALERSEETGETYAAFDYLLESLAKPDAYVVEGFKNEMAVVYAPPISLTLDEIKAVLLFLQSQGGDFDTDVVDAPSELAQTFYERIAAASAAGGGDPSYGQEVYEYNCEECHRIGDTGGEVGPDLSGIAARGVRFIADSILSPTREITEGYETWEVVRTDGRRILGIKTRDEADGVELMRETGEVVVIARSDIDQLAIDESRSLMPEDLNEAMTIKDFQDVQAYLMLQKQEQ